MIRLFNVPKRTSATPLPDVEAQWTLCTPKTAAPFSAIAYYFGLELHNRLGVPVGLIESAWGGTDIELAAQIKERIALTLATAR